MRWYWSETAISNPVHRSVSCIHTRHAVIDSTTYLRKANFVTRICFPLFPSSIIAMPESASTISSKLTDNPFELLDKIVSYINHPRDLLCFALTSKTMCRLVIDHRSSLNISNFASFVLFLTPRFFGRSSHHFLLEPPTSLPSRLSVKPGATISYP